MVEWKKLGTLGSFENIGTDKKIIDGEQLVTLLNYVDVYHHKHIDVSVPQMVVSASDKKIKDCSVEQGDIFVTPSSETVDDIGHSSVIEETISNAVYSYHIMRYRLFEKNMLLSYYINYAFDTDIVKKQILKKAQGLTRFGLSKDKFASIEIPIPSLSEQQRIVEQLDTFTSSIENLKEQIAQRRKQYEYYRDELLDLEGKEGVEIAPLRRIVKSYCTGATPNKGHLEYYESGTIPWLRTQDVKFNEIYEIDSFVTEEAVAKTGVKWIPANCVIVAISGATAGRCAINKIPTTTNQHCLNLEINPKKALYKYVYYCVYNAYSDMISKKQGARGDLNSSIILGITIPVPSLSEQQRIVSILDTFEASIQNLEAQLSQREKQYEYYRNKLLTFE